MKQGPGASTAIAIWTQSASRIKYLPCTCLFFLPFGKIELRFLKSSNRAPYCLQLSHPCSAIAAFQNPPNMYLEPERIWLSLSNVQRLVCKFCHCGSRYDQTRLTLMISLEQDRYPVRVCHWAQKSTNNLLGCDLKKRLYRKLVTYCQRYSGIIGFIQWDATRRFSSLSRDKVLAQNHCQL